MKLALAFVLGLAVLAVLPLCSPGQEASLLVGQNPLQVSLTALDGTPAFAPSSLAVPGVTSNSLTVDVGFNYIVPFWPSRSVRLSIPSAIPNAVLLGAADDLTREFTFVPRIDTSYQLTELGFGVAAAAEFVNLNGSLQRTLTSGMDAADLTAHSHLTLIVANLAEVTKSFLLGDYLDEGCLTDRPHLRDTAIQFTLGTRFTSLRQNYDATFSSGLNRSSVQAEQNFTGIGLTGSVASISPLGEYWSVYSIVRGSVLIGQNNRKSTASVLLVNNAAASRDTVLIENKTDLLPVGELELGVEYASPVRKDAPAGTASPLFVIRTGVVGQVYGGAGFLAATTNNVSFRDDSLYLVGVNLAAGVQW